MNSVVRIQDDKIEKRPGGIFQQWSFLVEGDEQPDQPNSQTLQFIRCCNFWAFKRNSLPHEPIAVVHFHLLKSSLLH